MFKRLLYLLIAASLLASCMDDVNENTNASQESNIENWLTKEYADSTVVYNQGVNRIVIVPGEKNGETAAEGDSISFMYIGYTFNKQPVSKFCEGEHKAKLGNGTILKGLDLGLTGTQKGEEALIVFSSKYGFYDQAVGLVPEMTALLFQVKVTDIY